MAQPLSVFRGNQVCTDRRPFSSQPGLLPGTHVHIWAQEPGLTGQHGGETRTWKHKFPGRRTTSGITPCRKDYFRENPLLSPLPSATRTLWPQTLPHGLLAFPPPCSKLCPCSSSFSLLLLSSSSPPPPPPLPPVLLPYSSSCVPPSIPTSLIYATLAYACHLPPSRASATTGCVWCLAPGSGPLPGAPRLYSTPRRAGRTYGSLTGAPATCVRWSQWHILAWVSRGPWEQ